MNSEVIALVLGSLALFLFSINNLSSQLQEVLGDKAKQIISHYNRNLFLSILIGTLVTIALGSSSAAIIIAIIFVNARSLTFRQAIGIVLGANIGTTFSSQLFALNIGEYAYIIMIWGLLMMFIPKNPRYNRNGKVTFFFGLLFFSLFLIEESLRPFQQSQTVLNFMKSIEDNPIKGAISGGVATLIIQSSSATVGLAIAMAKEGLIAGKAGLAVMLGAELGTCSDTLLATIGGSREALKTGLFHLTYSLVTVVLGLLLFDWFVHLVEAISGNATLQRQIANGHLLFNILGVLLFVPFVPVMERLLNKIIPSTNN
jgi:phosphate:Na+ symporter